MITLITGAPGSGKSLILVDEFLREAKEQNRKIIADGIPDLVIDHEPAQTVDKWTKQVEDASSQDGKKLLFDFPQGALVVIDECQRVFRPRKAGANVPAEVAAFETHRHQGLDFILITQHPGLLDSNVRRLVGRHLHIRDVGFLGRWVYEWPEATDPDHFKTALVKRKWKLPKKSFDLYKSSSLHVKPVRGFPTALKILMVSGVLLAGGVYYATQSISKQLNPQETKTAQHGPAKEGLQKAVQDYDPIADRLPKHPNYPESAPLYDGMRQVKAVPIIQTCMESKNDCKCYTQQMTRVHVTGDYCKRFVHDPDFDPFREDQKPQAVAKESGKPDHPSPAPVANGPQPGPDPMNSAPPVPMAMPASAGMKPI